MKKRIYLSLILSILCALPLTSAQAQGGEGPVYIVQSGDSLWAVAQRFGVSVDALSAQNGMNNRSQLSIGAHLVIPGLEGVTGILITIDVNYGESLGSLSRRYGISSAILSRLNHYTSPEEVYAGSSLIIIDGGEGDVTPGVGRATLKSGQSLLELAISHGGSPWNFVAENQLDTSWSVIAGDTLYYPDPEDHGPGALPESVTAVDVATSLLVQGQTMVVRLDADPGADLSGSFNGLQLNFFQIKKGKYVALQGIHAMLDPGYYDLAITGNLTKDIPIAFFAKNFYS